MGADNVKYADGKFAKAVFVKGGSGDPSMLPGTVDSVAVAPTFTVASLSGYGDDYFDSWYAYVVWDKGGAAAAPQRESQAITAYTSSTGTFAHAAFTVPLVAGDKVVISLSDPNAAGDASAANQATIIADTEKIYDVALGVSPAAGALSSFIATGGTALGTNLAASKSILDALGHDGTNDLNSGIIGQLQDYVTDDTASIYGRLGSFTGPVGGAAQDDNVKASLDLAHTDLDTIISNQTVGIKKGVERTIVFKMVDATDFATPEPSITVTEERSLDGGAFAACTNAASEIGGAGNGSGWYKITLTATEMNANEIIFKGTGAGCAQCDRLIVTEA